MNTVRGSAALTVVALAMLACGDPSRIADPATSLAPVSPMQSRAGDVSARLSTTTVNMLDNCDADSFNHNIGPGTCTHLHGMKFGSFIATLTATQSVPAWAFSPARFESTIGKTLDVPNMGGEVHTFTEVATFGGGVVPFLNKLSGTPEIAPECKTLDPTDFIVPGGVYHELLDHTGPVNFQCCIHPWMRATVNVGKGIGGTRRG